MMHSMVRSTLAQAMCSDEALENGDHALLSLYSHGPLKLLFMATVDNVVPATICMLHLMSVSLTVLQATELLREITAVDPADYEQQQHADAAGVRSVAAFIADLSDRYRQNACGPDVGACALPSCCVLPVMGLGPADSMLWLPVSGRTRAMHKLCCTASYIAGCMHASDFSTQLRAEEDVKLQRVCVTWAALFSICALPTCCRLPTVVAGHVSLLVPHLGGKAYSLRSAIVTAMGHLIDRAFGPAAEGTGAQGGGELRALLHCR